MGAWELFERARGGEEDAIDAAFEIVAIASRFHSTSVAEAVAERWLWGAGWKQVAYMLGCSRRSAIDRCGALLSWVDRNVEFDGEVRYVGASKSAGMKITGEKSPRGKITVGKSVHGKITGRDLPPGK